MKPLHIVICPVWLVSTKFRLICNKMQLNLIGRTIFGITKGAVNSFDINNDGKYFRHLVNIDWPIYLVMITMYICLHVYDSIYSSFHIVCIVYQVRSAALKHCC